MDTTSTGPKDRPLGSRRSDCTSSTSAARQDDPNDLRDPFGQVYVAGVGLGHEPVGDAWSAFDHDYLYFAKVPKQVVTGAHVFALGAGRQSAVLGLFEVIKAGANLSPKNPWDPDRWPYNLRVKPLASVPPPHATSVEGVRAPRGNAVHIRDEEQRAALYRAVA